MAYLKSIADTREGRRGPDPALGRDFGRDDGASEFDLWSGEPCYAVNKMEPLEPSDVMMMPASAPSSKGTLSLATPATQSLPPTARLENLHSGPQLGSGEAGGFPPNFPSASGPIVVGRCRALPLFWMTLLMEDRLRYGGTHAKAPGELQDGVQPRQI
jgi:hypothetical protein